jgi:hypothetical protein
LAFHSGRESDHSLPSSAEARGMDGAVPPLPQYAFMAWCSVRGSTRTSLPLPTRNHNMEDLELNVWFWSWRPLNDGNSVALANLMLCVIMECE